MTLDKRSAIGKMINGKKVVYECIRCKCKSIGDINTNVKMCPTCRATGEVILVIVENLLVRK